MAKATILIVEDNPDISQVIADALRFAGFGTLQAYNAVQGLQFASEHRPDLILMDIQLPDLDGLSAAETLEAGSGHATHPHRGDDRLRRGG